MRPLASRAAAPHPSPVDLHARPYREDDYWCVRTFLRRIHDGTRDLGAWDVARWDYWRWHGTLNCGDPGPDETCTVWETSTGELVGAVHGEARGAAFFQVDPAARTPDLDAAMVAAAEARVTADGRLVVWVPDSDPAWADTLARRGYARSGSVEHVRVRVLDAHLPEPRVADGYRIRPLGGDEDFPARGELSLRVFHPVPDGSTAMSADDYQNIQRCPLYRRDLDLVAEADGGDLAAFATFWFDDVTRTLTIEPVGTDAPHRRRGLGRALLLEGMRRGRWMGAATARVGSSEGGAHDLYASVGLRTAERLVAWGRDTAR